MPGNLNRRFIHAGLFRRGMRVVEGVGTGITGSAAQPLIIFADSLIHTRASVATLWPPDYGIASGTLYSYGTNVPRLLSTNGLSMPGGEDGYLNENSATNMLLRSSEFDNASWLVSGTGSTTANTQVAPDGTTTMDTLTDSSSSTLRLYSQTISVSGSAKYTFSCFIYKDGSNSEYPGFDLQGNVSGVHRVVLDKVTGATATTPNVDSVSVSSGTNHWRIQITITTSASDTSVTVRVNPAAASTLTSTFSVTPTGSTTFWGAQMELGSFATSYIATTTTTVTRASDTASVANADVDPTIWTGQFDIDVLPAFNAGTVDMGAASQFIIAPVGPNTDYIAISPVATSQIQVRFRSNGGANVSTSPNFGFLRKDRLTTKIVHGVSMDADVNGVNQASASLVGEADWPTGVNLNIASNGVGTNNFFGIVGEPVPTGGL